MAPDWTNEEAATALLEANRNLLTAKLRAHQYSEPATGTAINLIVQHPTPSSISHPKNELCLAQLQAIAIQSGALLKRVDEYVHSLGQSRRDADSRFNLQQKSVMSLLTTMATQSTMGVASTSRIVPTDAGQVMSGATTKIPPMGSVRPVTVATASGFGSQTSAQGSQTSSKGPMEG